MCLLVESHLVFLAKLEITILSIQWLQKQFGMYFPVWLHSCYVIHMFQSKPNAQICVNFISGAKSAFTLVYVSPSLMQTFTVYYELLMVLIVQSSAFYTGGCGCQLIAKTPYHMNTIGYNE